MTSLEAVSATCESTEVEDTLLTSLFAANSIS